MTLIGRRALPTSAQAERPHTPKAPDSTSAPMQPQRPTFEPHGLKRAISPIDTAGGTFELTEDDGSASTNRRPRSGASWHLDCLRLPLELGLKGSTTRGIRCRFPLSHHPSRCEYRTVAHSLNLTRTTNMRSLPLIALFLTFAGPRAVAGVPTTVAIAADTSGLPPKIAAEVQDGLVTHILSGLDQVISTRWENSVSLAPVSESRVLDQIVECESTECLQDVAEAAQVDLVLQVRLRIKQSAKRPSRRAKPDYLVSMVVARAKPDRDAWTEKTDCLACEASEIKHAASLLASVIAEHINVKRNVPVETPAPKVATAPPPAPPAPPPMRAVKPRPVAPKSHASMYLSLAALAGGAALVGTGLYLVHLDGEGTCTLSGSQELCARRYQTRPTGIGLVAGGGLAAIAGLVGLVVSSSSSDARVALAFTGSSFIVSGGF
jgi:hypothetical protein